MKFFGRRMFKLFQICLPIWSVLQTSDGIELLGTSIFSSKYFLEASMYIKVEKVHALQTCLDALQVELHLLCSCLSVCKINHILRTTASGSCSEALKRFHLGLQHTFESITLVSLDDAPWQQATLTVHLGGLGIREASSSTPAAFLGIHNSTCVFTSLLIGRHVIHRSNHSGNEDRF